MAAVEIFPQPINKVAQVLFALHVAMQFRLAGMHVQIAAIHFEHTLLFLIEKKLGHYHGNRTWF
jgi:hypothetical protein